MGEQKRALTLWGPHELCAKQSIGSLSFSHIDWGFFFFFVNGWVMKYKLLKPLSISAGYASSVSKAQRSHCVLQTAACQLQTSRWFVHVRILNTTKSHLGKWRKWQKKILEGICWCARADGGWLFTNNPSVIRECAGRWPFLAVRLSYACRLLTKQYQNSDFFSGTVSGWLDTECSLIIWLILHETSIVW